MDRSDRPLILLVYLGGLLAAAQFGKAALTLPLLAEAFGRDVAGVAVLVSLVGLMGLVLGAMAGGVVAALGPGRSYLGGLALGGAVSLLLASMPPFPVFAALRAVEGIAHLALVVAGPPLIAAAASDRDRPLAMGLWGTFFGTSLALSALAFPRLVGAGGLPLLFLANGAAMLALAALLWRRVPRIARAPLDLRPVAVHRAVYGRLAQVAPALGFFPYTFLFLAALTFLPEALGRPVAAASVWSLVTLASTLAGGALCRRLPPWWVTVAGFMGTALGAGGIALGVPLAAEAMFAAMGLVPGASFAAIAAWNADPRSRARATGAIAQFGNLGTVTGTPVMALLFAAGGREALLALVLAACALGAVLAAWSGARAEAGLRGLAAAPEDC
ncbi:MFS transporter [Jannaschia sp. W003]|uniref:MFS transporter n=1 Tax=Jannaschia sp. W003 TaxID=2867012 RepID=UPI0021A8D022|nr:MFS transporter [Jannaschia sp. W003]UWQ20734.1 MFS transporter [Jannaschia sp. W003]